jgi:copper chaperone NosL
MDGKELPVLYLPLDRTARIIQLLLIVPLLLSFFQPLWRISLKAPQYPYGLYMDIYSYKLVGGNDGQDINEINELNHYIGMQKIERGAFADLDWMPFAFGILALLALRVAAIGNLYSLVDLTVLTLYVSMFGMFRFAYREYVFGHNLDPHAAVKIQPFTPVILGTKQVANFSTTAMPQLGSLLVGLFVTGLLFLTIRQFFAARSMRIRA